LKALAKDLYIKHFQYGCGVVTESDSEHTRIDFDLHGMKLFMTGLMVVEPAEGIPPKRSKRKKKILVPGAPLTEKEIAKNALKAAAKAAKAASKAALTGKSAPKTEEKPEAKVTAGAK
jgi:hypothetical protein